MISVEGKHLENESRKQTRHTSKMNEKVLSP